MKLYMHTLTSFMLATLVFMHSAEAQTMEDCYTRSESSASNIARPLKDNVREFPSHYLQIIHLNVSENSNLSSFLMVDHGRAGLGGSCKIISRSSGGNGFRDVSIVDAFSKTLSSGDLRVYVPVTKFADDDEDKIYIVITVGSSIVSDNLEITVSERK